MRASIAIASHNEGDLLWKTVRSCLETTEGLDVEVVVADDASTDGSVAELLRRYPDIKTDVAPRRVGVSPTKDRAGRMSSGDVILFLDAHCKPEPGAVERLIRDVEECDGDAIITPKVAALDVETWTNKSDQVGYGFLTELSWFDCKWIARDQLKEVQGPRGRTYLRQPSVIGCCVALRRDLYEKLWGFDPHMKTYGSEDIDFGLKSWLMGHPVYLDEEVTIGHRFRGSFTNYEVPNPHQLLNQLRMARKNFTEPTWEIWLKRNQNRYVEPTWRSGLELFEESRGTVERERDYLMKTRKHDEFWYADQFGLTATLLANTNEKYPMPVTATLIPHPSRSPEPVRLPQWDK